MSHCEGRGQELDNAMDHTLLQRTVCEEESVALLVLSGRSDCSEEKGPSQESRRFFSGRVEGVGLNRMLADPVKTNV